MTVHYYQRDHFYFFKYLHSSCIFIFHRSIENRTTLHVTRKQWTKFVNCICVFGHLNHNLLIPLVDNVLARSLVHLSYLFLTLLVSKNIYSIKTINFRILSSPYVHKFIHYTFTYTFSTQHLKTPTNTQTIIYKGFLSNTKYITWNALVACTTYK